MKRHILCIDLDDTISNTYSTVLKLAKEYDKKELNRTGMAEENIKSSDDYYFARMLKWTREETITFYQKYYPTYLNDIVPNEEAAEALNELKKCGITIHIVTARREKDNYDVLSITKNWLSKYRIVYDDLTINIIDKGDIVKSIGGKYFLDDSVDNCISVKKKNPNTYVFLLTTNYNIGLECDKIHRVKNLQEFVEIVRRIENGEKYNY